MAFLLNFSKNKQTENCSKSDFYQENLYFELSHFNYEQYIFCFTIMKHYNEIYSYIPKLPLIANNSVLWNLIGTFLLF